MMARIKLGDVAAEVRNTWSGETAGIPLVGLEHLVPGDILLKNWATDIADSTFTKAFKKGQILLGRRRVYLKKAVLAPFAGICSGDITVIESNPEKLSPRLLPFIIQNNKFFDYAMQGSAGSLSPRVKWAHLAEYEFDLPSLDEQERLADLLWAANDLKEAYQRAIAASDEMAKSRFIEMFGTENSPKNNVRFMPLGKIASYINGFAFKPEDWGKEGLPIIRIQNLTGTSTEYNYFSGIYPQQVEVQDGDVLISWSASLGIYLWNSGKAILNQHIFKVAFDKMPVNKKYFIYAVSQKLNDLIQQTHGSTMKHIVKKKFDETTIAYPSEELQQTFAAFIEQLDKSKFTLTQAISDLDKTIKALLNQALEA